MKQIFFPAATIVATLFSIAYGIQNTQLLSVLDTSQFDGVINIGVPISIDYDDNNAEQSAQQIGGWTVFVDYVNTYRVPAGVNYNGGQYYIQLLMVEDYSTAAGVTSATQTMIDGNAQIVPDLYFAPYGSANTNATLQITDPNNKLLLACSSSSTKIWQSPPVDYGFTTLYSSATWYSPTLNYYAASPNNAKTAAFFCNSCTNGQGGCTGNTCTTFVNSEADLSSTFSAAGITLTNYFELDSTSSTYQDDFANDVATIASTDVDVVVILDYSVLCEDFPGYAISADYNPKGMLLVICGSNSNVITTMGTNIIQATTSVPWSSQSTTSSGITSMSNSDFVTAFESLYNVQAVYTAAEAYSSAEIVLQAIEDTNSLDTTALTNYITNQAAFYPLLTGTSAQGSGMSFPSDTHQAVGDYLCLQFNDALVSYPATTSNLIYPMSSWADKASGSSGASPTNMPVTAPASTPSGSTPSGSTTNNYYNSNDDDKYTGTQAVGLALTGIFCFLGGIAVAVLLLVYIPKSFSPRPPMSMTTEMTSSSV